MICPDCGQVNRDTATFCVICGAQLSQADVFRATPLEEIRPTKPTEEDLGTLRDGRYKILKKLGEGGMGRIYLTRDLKMDYLVVIKELLPIFVTPQEREYVEKRFTEEAKILFRLDFRGLPKVIDYFQDKGNMYIVMQYIEGENLAQIVKNRPVPRITIEECVEWMRELLEILKYLHNQNPPIIHRDIKPKNIMMNNRGELFLVDFGLARTIGMHTHTGTSVGTYGYSSPEHFSGKFELSSDIFSLGATFHHLLSGDDPQSRDTFDYPPLNKYIKDFPPKLQKIFDKMLDVRKSQRFQRVEFVIDALDEFAAEYYGVGATHAPSAADIIQSPTIQPTIAAPIEIPQPTPISPPVAQVGKAGSQVSQPRKLVPPAELRRKSMVGLSKLPAGVQNLVKEPSEQREPIAVPSQGAGESPLVTTTQVEPQLSQQTRISNVERVTGRQQESVATGIKMQAKPEAVGDIEKNEQVPSTFATAKPGMQEAPAKPSSFATRGEEDASEDSFVIVKQKQELARQSTISGKGKTPVLTQNEIQSGQITRSFGVNKETPPDLPPIMPRGAGASETTIEPVATLQTRFNVDNEEPSDLRKTDPLNATIQAEPPKPAPVAPQTRFEPPRTIPTDGMTTPQVEKLPKVEKKSESVFEIKEEPIAIGVANDIEAVEEKPPVRESQLIQARPVSETRQEKFDEFDVSGKKSRSNPVLIIFIVLVSLALIGLVFKFTLFNKPMANSGGDTVIPTRPTKIAVSPAPEPTKPVAKPTKEVASTPVSTPIGVKGILKIAGDLQADKIYLIDKNNKRTEIIIGELKKANPGQKEYARDLEPGTYTIKFKRENYVDVKKTGVNIEPGKEVIITDSELGWIRKPSILIKTNKEANISIYNKKDGSLAGKLKTVKDKEGKFVATKEGLDEGIYKIVASREGYYEDSKEVKLQNGKTGEVAINLKEIPPQPKEVYTPPPREPAYVPPERPVYRPNPPPNPPPRPVDPVTGH